MMSVRFESDVARQAGKAAVAAATAAPSSSAEAKSTSFVTWPVAGSKTWPSRPDVPGTKCPPIQWLTRAGVVASERTDPGSATCVMGDLACGAERRR